MNFKNYIILWPKIFSVTNIITRLEASDLGDLIGDFHNHLNLTIIKKS
jgi:hypothetical protein